MTDHGAYPEDYWVVGGSLPLHAPSYVKRRADEDLYQRLLGGHLCYVFNSRQMGKSSLRVRTTSRLQAAGVRCGVIDLSEIGSQNLTPEQWYAGLTRSLVSSFGLELKLSPWWHDRVEYSPLQRLRLFIVEELLGSCDDPMVIFIDEIDTILNLPFSVDDFFAFIRACYNNRSDTPVYRRLGFALFGVTTPSDLIRNDKITPFNIGDKAGAIQLEGFKLTESEHLLDGLRRVVNNPDIVLGDILRWTGGQPFLTQKICDLFYKAIQAKSSVPITIAPHDVGDIVRKIVERKVIKRWEAQDIPEHLRTIRDRLLHNTQQAGQILGLYKNLLEQGELFADDNWPGLVSLELSGLVRRRDDRLTIRNHIYRDVFNEDWVDDQIARLRPYDRDLQNWLDTGKQDDSPHLLRGSRLAKAQTWADEHNISEVDYQFLAASRDLENRLRERLLESERVQAVEAQLDAEKKSAKRQQFLLMAVSVGLLVSCGLGLFAFRQYRQAIASQRQAVISQLESVEREIEAIAAIADTRFSSRQTLDALIEAIRAHRRLGELEQLSTGLKRPITVPSALKQQVFDTLQRTLFGVVEFNRLSVGDLPEPLLGVAYSPDGTQIATVGDDGKIYVWQSNGKLLKTLTGHLSPVQAVAFSPDGRHLASVDVNGDLGLWDLNDWDLDDPDDNTRDLNQSPIPASVSALNQVVYSAGGNWLATVSDDGDLKLWQPDGSEIRTIAAHPGFAIHGLAVSPDDLTLATGAEDNTIKLWDLNGNLLRTLAKSETVEGHDGPVETLAFSPDGITLISGSSDNTLKRWRVRDGTLLTTFRGHTAAIHSVALSADGQTVASTSADTTIKLWATDGTILTTFSGHNAAVRDVAFSTQHQQLATASEDGTVRLWRPRNDLLNPLNGHGAAVNSVEFSPSGFKLITASDDNTAKLWQQDEGALLHTFTGHTGRVSQAAWSPDGTMIATAGEDKTIKLWRVLDGRLLYTLPEAAKVTGHGEPITSLAFSPDGRVLASASTDNNLHLWQVSNGKLQESFSGPGRQIDKIVFSPDGESIAMLGQSNIAFLMTLESSEIQRFDYQDHTPQLAQANDISFSADGNWVATAHADGSVILWDRQGNPQRSPLIDPSDSPSNTPSSENAIDTTDIDTTDIDTTDTSGSADDSNPQSDVSDADGLLTDSSGLESLGQLEQNDTLTSPSQGSSIGVNAVAFSPDGRYLATANQDHSIRIWQRDNGQLLNTLRGHDGSVLDVDFSPDGAYLVSTGQDRKVLLWNLERVLNADQLLDYACDWVHDYLVHSAQSSVGNQSLCDL